MEIGELAKMASLSSFYYQRLFKRLVKKTVMEYVRLRRLAMAVDKLRKTKDRILDVALSLGFTSHEQFTRTFRETFGMTPKDYRKNPITLNYMTKPQLLLNYVMVDENVPLIVEDIVLEVGRRDLSDAETFIGIEVQAPVSHLEGIGVESGKDPLSDVWDILHKLKAEFTGFIGEELGALYISREEGAFSYFAGGKLRGDTFCEKRLQFEQEMKKQTDRSSISYQFKEWEIVKGEYLVCSFEAETFESLVMDVIYKANMYIYNIWMPRHHLTGEAYSIERYTKRTDHPAKMEIWIKLKQQV